MPERHTLVLDDNGFPDCCPLPKSHPAHAPTVAQAPPTAPLAPVRDLGVSLTPGQADTSQKAALGVWPRAGTQRAQILDALAACGDHGATDDELAWDTDLSGNTIRPRRGELAGAGWVTQARNADGTPRTRPSNEGNDAAVWVLTPAAQQRLDGAA